MRFRTLFVVSLLALPGREFAAQVPATTPRVGGAIATGATSNGATISGVVRDTMARAPLAGAWVQLAAHEGTVHFARTVSTDSLGRFTITDVPPGRYALGFYHSTLDSIGVEPSYREVRVTGRAPVRVDLSTPSPSLLSAAMCGPQPVSDSATGALLVGIVRDERDRAPLAGVKVIGEWIEFTFRKGAIDRRRPRLVATTGENGWFVMCHVPSGGTLALLASKGADTTDVIEVQVPRSGFLRRELFLGAARTTVIEDSASRTGVSAGGTARPDSLEPIRRRVRLGSGRLRGTVVTAEGNRPLEGALVRITDGPQTRANDRGEWTLVNAPSGTRVLEVRAVGYFPVQRPVDVLAGAAPVTVELLTFQAMLDTVRITVSRASDRSGGGFDLRQRSSIGRFLTEEFIARRADFFTSDLLRMVAGVRIEGTGQERQVFVRSDFGEYCTPAVYINGLYMTELSADEIDVMTTPRSIKGIEVYVGANTPVEFQRALSGCGALVIWTK